jgi:hypothetical protein
MVDVNLDSPPNPDLEEGAEPETSTAIAPRGSIEVGRVQGEVSARDLQFPALNIVSKMGKLTDTFKPGDLVLNREYFLTSRGGPPVKIVVMNLVKSYQERFPEFNASGPRPKAFKTLREVVDAGLYLDWRNNEKPTAEEVATALLLIQKPADLACLAFNNTLDGQDYALARWIMTRTAYTHAACQMFTKSQIELRDGLELGLWELSTKVETIRGNAVDVPVLRLLPGQTTENFRKEARALFAGR